MADLATAAKSEVPAAPDLLNALLAEVAVIDSGGTILLANEAWSRFSTDNGGNRPLALGVGLNYLDVCRSASAAGSSDAKEVLIGLEDVLRGNRLQFCTEYPCDSPTERRWFLLQVTRLRNPDGGALLLHVEITARKLLEEALLQSEREHRLVAQLAGVLATTMDFDERLAKIAQLSSRELADLSVVDIVADDGSIRRVAAICKDPLEQWRCEALMRPPLDSDKPHTIRQEAAAGEFIFVPKATPNDIGLLTENSDQRAALQDAQSIIVAPLLTRGQLIGTVSLWSFSRAFGEHDVRMVRGMSRLASLMLDNARLLAAAKQATQARDDMLGVVAHDLRGPLTAVAALGGALRMGAEREIGKQIELSSKRMSRLIQDLIDVTRMEVGPLTLKQRRLRSEEVLSEAIASQAPLASAASVEIHFDAAQDLPDLWADHHRLLQVFENLIGNALKFTQPGGHITISAKSGPSEVLFSVADTGSGIESKLLPHVFDRFWQAPGAVSSGAGLGLAIVKGIVDSHGGRVWVQSSLGEGSTFFFTIPTAPTASMPQQLAESRC